MNDSVIDIFSLCRFFFKFGGNLTSRWYLHSPPSGKEGWLKAGVVGRYTMLIITDLRIHLPPPPYGDSSFLKEENVEYYRLSNYYFLN